jgi:hypothetical protein
MAQSSEHDTPRTGSEQIECSLKSLFIKVADDRLILGANLLQGTRHDDEEASVAFSRLLIVP